MTKSLKTEELSRFDQKISQLSKLFCVKKTADLQCSSENATQRAFRDLPNTIHPLERYLQYPCSKRRLLFFETLKPDNVLLGKIIRLHGNNVASVKVVSITDGQRRWLKDLDIFAILHNLNLHNQNNETDDESSEMEIGDYVKAVVIRIDPKLEEIVLSIDMLDLPPSARPIHRLGKLNEDDIDCFRKVDDDDIDEEDVNTYLDHLKESNIYNHPQSISMLANHFNMDQTNDSFFHSATKTKKVKETVAELHENQSYNWSMNMVGVGVKHFRQKELKEAEKCFDQALTFYPKNVEGFVARGAMKANQNKLQDAVKDFKKALQIDPKHRNGKKYLIETTLSIARGYEKELKWKDSLQCYQDILKIEPGHEESKERYQHTRQLLSRKMVAGGELSSKPTKKEDPEKVKRKGRIQQLRDLMKTDKNNKTTSSSSSSSASSSSSSSTSSSDEELTRDEWIEANSSSSKPSSSSRRKGRKTTSNKHSSNSNKSKSKRRNYEETDGSHHNSKYTKYHDDDKHGLDEARYHSKHTKYHEQDKIHSKPTKYNEYREFDHDHSKYTDEYHNDHHKNEEANAHRSKQTNKHRDDREDDHHHHQQDFDDDSKEIMKKISQFTSAEREAVRRLLMQKKQPLDSSQYTGDHKHHEQQRDGKKM